MKLDWYFDFVSPFSYLQLERFDRLPAGTEVTLKPILFGALLKHLNQRGPAEIPHKREFTYKHVQWQADQAGIPLRFPPAHPFNPVRARCGWRSLSVMISARFARFSVSSGNRAECRTSPKTGRR